MGWNRAWVVSVLAVSFVAGGKGAFARGWDKDNAPSRLEFDFNPSFNALPLRATVPTEHKPYADTYWPSNRGGIAYRWNSREIVYTLDTKKPTRGWVDPNIKLDWKIFKFRSPTRAMVKKMTRDQLAQLSPTEKFDLVRGQLDKKGEYVYWLTWQVLGNTSRINPHRAYWDGICHGWAPASVNHSEPLPIDIRNRDGVVIPFGSADVKALLDYYYATQSTRASHMGWKCQVDLTKNPNTTDEDCADVNAGSFHIALANYVGLRGVAVIADVSMGHEMWNNALYAYEATVLGRSGPARTSAPGTYQRVHLRTVVRFPSDNELLPPQWEATVGKTEIEVPDTDLPEVRRVFDPKLYEDKYRYETLTWEYWLELDRQGRIIGGEWVGDHPDYLWKKNKLRFVGEFSILDTIYKPMFHR